MIDFLTANVWWIGLIVFMVAMHRHGGCGMHHTHDHDKQSGASESSADTSESPTNMSQKPKVPSGHEP